MRLGLDPEVVKILQVRREVGLHNLDNQPVALLTVLAWRKLLLLGILLKEVILWIHICKM